MKPAPTPAVPRKPWFYTRATVEILLYAIREAEAAQERESTGRYSVVAPRTPHAGGDR